jgi:FMN phosphatase YigB (HAD superfamily)
LGGFKQVIPSSLVGIPKQDPEILLLATSLLVIEPEELLHVGDNAEEDGLAAKAAGCPFHKVQANAGPSLPALSAQINSLGSSPE